MSVPGIVFADLELAITGYLRTALAARPEPVCAGVHVSIAVPNPRQSRMVIVRRNGGRRLDATRESARFGVQVWGATFAEAVDLGNIVRALMQALPDGAPILSASELSAFSPVDDDSGQPMRFGTFEVTDRRTTLT